MRIYLTSVLVDDQEKALRFYTDVLGFVKKNDIPLGEARWLTVVSPDDPQGTELILEPDALVDLSAGRIAGKANILVPIVTEFLDRPVAKN